MALIRCAAVCIAALASFAAAAQWTCIDGVPSALSVTPATGADVPVNSVQWADYHVDALDAAGNHLRNVRLSFTLPAASPSGTFSSSGAQRGSADTGPNCSYGAMPLMIADGVAGSFAVRVEVENNPAVSASIALRSYVPDAAAGLLQFDFTYPFSSTGGLRKPFTGNVIAKIVTRNPYGEICCGWAGVPITVTAPASGPSATFPDGSRSVTVITDAGGSATLPTLTANDIPGSFALVATSPPRAPVEFGLRSVGQRSVTEVSSDALQYRSEFPFAKAPFAATVTFPDLPCGDPSLNGPAIPAVSLNVNGHAWYRPVEDLGQQTYRPAACPVRVKFRLPTDTLAFGRNVVQFSFDGDAVFDSSTSQPLVIDVDAQASGDLATGTGTWRAGAMYHDFAPSFAGYCRFTQARSVAASGAGAPPPGQSFPFGFLSYEIAGCKDSFPGLLHRLVVELDQDIPAGATAWAYVPASVGGAASWIELRASFEGKRAQMVVADDGAGDDPATGPRLLRGIVGIAVPRDGGLMNVAGQWWGGPSQNGWGIAIAQHGAQLVATLFVYDDAGDPRWLIVPGGSWSSDMRTFSGAVYRPTMQPAYLGTLVPGAPVGTATLTFTDADRAALAFTIDGIAGTRSLVRQVFAATTPLLRWNYGDLWWPGAAKAGYGISLAQQGDSLFAVSYGYDPSGKTSWLVMPDGAWQSPTSYRGMVYTTHGSPWLAGGYDAARLTAYSDRRWGYDFSSTQQGTEYQGSWRTSSDFGGPTTSAIERQPF